MEAAMQDGLKKGEAAMKDAIAKVYLMREQPAEGVKLVTETYTSAKEIEGPVEDAVAVTDATMTKHLTDAGNFVVGAQPEEAVTAAKAAHAAAKAKGEKSLEVPALRMLVAACAAKRDFIEAAQFAKELAKIARKSGNKKAEVLAMKRVANVALAGGDPGQAIAAAEEAVEVARGSGDSELLASALSAVYAIHRVVGKPASAQKAAKEAAAAVKGNAKLEAAALLMVGDAHPTSKESLAAAKNAVQRFRDAGNRLGEGAALIAVAFAHGSQTERQYEEGVKAATEALAIFREKGDKVGQALALSTASRANALKEDAQESARLAKEAVQLFREARSKLGEAYASDLVVETPFAGVQQVNARLLFDEDSIAHVEVNEAATQDSLESIIATLHNWSSRDKGKNIKGVALHVEGTAAPARLQCYAMSSGAFIVGLRSLGIPITSGCWGTITGPAWGLALAGDYRIASADTNFILPILRPIQCLAHLLGQNNATHLTMSNGPMTALAALEMGIFHQVHKDQEHTQKATWENSKRISQFPSLAARQTLTLMAPGAEKFAFVQ